AEQRVAEPWQPRLEKASMSYGTGGYGPPPPPPPGQGPPLPPPPGHGPPPPPGGFGGGMGGPPPPPPPPPGANEPPASMGNAIGVIIASVISLCLCWPLALVSLVLGIVAAVMAASSPKASKTCALIGWILVGVGLVLTVILFFV